MYKSKKGGVIGIIITITILVLIVVFSNIDTNIGFFEGAANKLVMPVQNGMTYLKNRIKRKL